MESFFESGWDELQGDSVAMLGGLSLIDKNYAAFAELLEDPIEIWFRRSWFFVASVLRPKTWNDSSGSYSVFSTKQEEKPNRGQSLFAS